MEERENPAGPQEPALPLADIPNLKKREKERKRAGAAWGGGRPAGTAFTGATGGSGTAGMQTALSAGHAAAAAPGGAAALAAEAVGGAAGAPGLMGWLSSASGGWLGGANASLLGKLLMTAGAAALLAGAGLYAYLRLQAKPAGPGSGLGPISDSIRVRRGTEDERLRLAADGARGQLKFEGPQTQAETAAPEEKGSAPAEQKKEPAEANPWGDVLAAVQNQNGFTSQNVAGLPSGSEGEGSFFSPRPGGGRGAMSMPSLRYPGQSGHLTAMPHGSAHTSLGRALRTARIRSGRAFAQLRYSRGMSLLGARGASEQGMRASAADAFEQNQGQDGQIASVDSPVPGAKGAGEYGPVTPAGQLPNPYALPDQPTTPNPTPVGGNSPYQNALDALKDLLKKAGMLKLLSMALIAAGIGMIIAGSCCIPPNWGLIAAGIAMVCMGLMMLMMAVKMGNQAKAMAAQLSSSSQLAQYQQDNVNSCAAQAVAQGLSDPDSQCTSDQAQGHGDSQATYHYGQSASQSDKIQQDVTTERNANYEVQEGKPSP